MQRVSLVKSLNSAFEFSARLVIIGAGRSIFLWFAGAREIKKRSLLPVPSLLASLPLPTPPCPQLVAKLPNCQWKPTLPSMPCTTQNPSPHHSFCSPAESGCSKSPSRFRAPTAGPLALWRPLPSTSLECGWTCYHLTANHTWQEQEGGRGPLP